MMQSINVIVDGAPVTIKMTGPVQIGHGIRFMLAGSETWRCGVYKGEGKALDESGGIDER